MKRYHSWNQLLVVLTVITALLATSCGGAATEAPTIELYLPDNLASDNAIKQIESQVAQWPDNPGFTVNLVSIPESDLFTTLSTMVAAGTPPAMAALLSDDVREFAQKEMLLSLGEPGNFDAHRNDMVQNITVGDQIYGYPWQGYSACRSQSLDLVIFQNPSQETIDAARSLGEFLTNYDNQLSNLENPDLSWHPTLNQIYADKGMECLVVNSTDETLIAEAQAKAKNFSGAFGVQIDDLKAVALDAAEVGGEAGKLASAMAPAVDDKQIYKDRLVLGYLSIDHQNIADFSGLPVGEYLIGCLTETWDCVAMPNPDEEIPISPDKMYIEPFSAEGTSAFYERGSIGGCFKAYDDVRVCISLF